MLNFNLGTQMRFLEVVEACQEIFETQLIPVDPNAQKSVAVPKGIDLDEWVYEPPEVEGSSDEEEPNDDFDISDLGKEIEIEPSMPDQTENFEASSKRKKLSKKERKRIKKERDARIADDPYYITEDKLSSREREEIDNIDTEEISFADGDVKRLRPKKSEEFEETTRSAWNCGSHRKAEEESKIEEICCGH
eukprot:TRINITY_DN632_c0_g1_i1.p1 TRINITY_DN632_c0_g1~~TRINITY_DN632_c0_g1_i1.p1  ORF type:complete len:192 (-),score=56.45 TRINITY_DN632_c0_g1_i1:271-846(-)